VNINRLFFSTLKHLGVLMATVTLSFGLRFLTTSKGNVILIEDRAPYHKRLDVVEFKKQASRLSVYPSPAFSPDFNPIKSCGRIPSATQHI